MEMDHADDRARARERVYDRRAARTRRSKWLGRVLFSLTGTALVLVLRMNPAVVEDVVAWSHKSDAASPPRILTQPADIHVRVMPSDSVPVRRGGTLPGNGTRAPQGSSQAHADAVAQTLGQMTPGG